ncbi:MAG: ATP-binding cassette domain-containing protein [Candidatus Promineofilum sp.]|nr:ATP-binding cassette domain-containing protein [Promineifilum sp.]
MSDKVILEMRHITKEFPGVKALDDISFRVKEGEIHCLVGENGAGKSTLMKVLSGVYPHGDYSGEIILDGQAQQFSSIRDSERAGISIIYQELALIPELTVYENIFLGNEIRKGWRVDWNETIKQATAMLKKVKLNINAAAKIAELGVGQQQLVEIAKALTKDVRLLILDEPTSALNEGDVDNLFDLLRELKGQGVTCIMISHKLKEVMEIADTVTVIRDGRSIATLDAHKGEVSEQVLIKNMVGREIDNIFPGRTHERSEEVVLRVKGWDVYNPAVERTILKNAAFDLKRGEIVGFAGLMGSGRTELALSIFGNPQGYKIEGELEVKGKEVRFRHPEEAIRAGVAYVSEDRKRNGLILIQDVRENTTLANLRALAHRGVLDSNAEIKVANEYKQSLNIKTPTVQQTVGNLSGGNQQKVSLAKWLFVTPDILILDEPTRGIDVGAKFEIYTLMNQLVEQGMSIMMISSELPEVLGMSDRVYVMSAGEITGELDIEEADQEAIMRLATVN